jgi:uncharacterized protein
VDIVDAHTHIFPPDIIKNRERLAREDAGFGALYGSPKAAMSDAHGLLAYMEEEGISASVAFPFPFKDKHLLRLANDYVLHTARNHPSLIPFAAVNIEDENGALAEAERCIESGARGIGEIGLYDQALAKKQLGALEGVAGLAEDGGLVLVLHMNEQVGHAYKGKTTIDLPAVAAFIGAHPKLKVVLAHLGGGLCFYEFMPEIRETFSRVYYDTAALPFIYSEGIYRFIENHLAGKTLFGSDFPLLSHKRYRGGLETMGQEKRGMVLSGNLRGLLWRA